MPQITSQMVCHSLSFSTSIAFGDCVSINSFSSFCIWFSDVACCQAWYLRLAASYQKRKEKVNAIANSIESSPAYISTTVHILEAIPAWTDGNHPDDHSDDR